ncbi:MAG: carboxypeptidase regulatory-like domain-containing protein [Ferruginibacter sp.]
MVDTATRQMLTGATVSVTFTKDSAMASYMLSDKKGAFELKGLAYDNYKLHISFNGYKAYQRSFTLSAAEANN